jgi:hypothetical protein
LGISQQQIQYLLTNPSVVGAVGWAGLLATIVGLSVAIRQIQKVKTAADASTAAARNLANDVRQRERLLELTTARAHLENAGQHIVRQEFPLAGVFVDLAINDCVQVKELLEAAEQKRLYAAIVRLRKLGEALIQSTADGTEKDKTVPLTTEARAIMIMLSENAARIRYKYNDEG